MSVILVMMAKFILRLFIVISCRLLHT